jgi:hypothetical protein
VEKIDLRKELKHLYRPSAKTITEVQVPLFTYLMIDGRSGRRGKHHEIYLTDIRRTDPSRWKTVIRQPMG